VGTKQARLPQSTNTCLLPETEKRFSPSKTRRGCGADEHLLSQQAHSSRKAPAWEHNPNLSLGGEEGKRQRVSTPPKTQTPRLYFLLLKNKKGPPRAERAGVCFGSGGDGASPE
jgi:hypothetical protein